MNTIESNAQAEVKAQREAAEGTLPKGIDEELVRQKVRAGLTRSQAIEVIQRQAKADAAAEEAAKKKADQKPPPPAKNPEQTGAKNPPSAPKAPKGTKPEGK